MFFCWHFFGCYDHGGLKMRIKLFLLLACLFLHSSAKAVFCSECTVIQFEHISKDDYIAYYNNQFLPMLNYLQSDFNEFQVQVNAGLNGVSSTWSYMYGLYQNAIIDQNTFDNFNMYLSPVLSALEAMNNYNIPYVQAGIDQVKLLADPQNIAFTNSEFCVECLATGGGGGECALCLDCETALQSLDDYLSILSFQIENMQTSIDSIKSTLNLWFEKWQAQDDKLQPLIDELQPMLYNIKKYYDDYASGEWDASTWVYLKDVIVDLSTLDIVSKWGRFFGDYYDSTFGSDNWNDIKNVNIALTYALNSGEEGFKGKDGFKYLLVDYAVQKDKPFGVNEDIKNITLNDYKYLNWFQKIAVALGRMSFDDVSEENREKIRGLSTSTDDIQQSIEINKGYIEAKRQMLRDKLLYLGDKMEIVSQNALSIYPSGVLPEEIILFAGRQGSSVPGQKVFPLPAIKFKTAPWQGFISGFRSCLGFLYWLFYIVALVLFTRYVLGFFYRCCQWVVSAVSEFGNLHVPFAPNAGESSKGYF